MNVCHDKPLTSLLSAAVRVKTPQNLSVEPQQVGGHRLTWDSPYPGTSPLTSDLHYQVTYGTDGLEWQVRAVYSLLPSLKDYNSHNHERLDYFEFTVFTVIQLL